MVHKQRFSIFFVKHPLNIDLNNFFNELSSDMGLSVFFQKKV